MTKKDTIAKWTLTAAFGVAAYVFWAVFYRAALSYQEQFQLFQCDKQYLLDHLAWPGGIATYISEFFVQLYNNYWVGALIIALLLVAVQLLTQRLAAALSGKSSLLGYMISFLPAIGLWMYMGDINHMESLGCSLIFALLVAWWFAKIKSNIWQIVFVITVVPLFYWLMGTSVYLLAALMCLKVWTMGAQYAKRVGASVAILAYTAAIVAISFSFVSYSPKQMLIGINYYRIWETMPTMLWLTWALSLVSVVAAVLVAKNEMFTNKITLSATFVVVVAFAILGIRGSFERRIYDLVEYDYLLRTNKWDAIIAKSKKRMPNTQLSIFATNLALAMKGELTTRAFDFYQYGVEGLFPAFQMESNTTMMAGEAYYQLGMINTAQRYAFEAMEANGNFNKSVRCIKRLAETNMLRGNYEVAEKYLKLLDKTLVYRNWAKRMRKLINTPGAIDAHPVYGRLRSLQINDNFLFSDLELDKIMGQLYTTNPSNNLAMQYLLMYPLMQRDLDKFMQYLSVVQRRMPCKTPVTQQAVIMAYVNAGMDVPAGLVDPMVMQSFKEFAQIMTTKGKTASELDRFRHTLWYYLMVN